ncbi:MAG: M48 family metallopeptidase [Acidobacteriaceae bacterium]|nr:M48 family metallopeptidase [Acidobacteriaceae bacterium]
MYWGQRVFDKPYDPDMMLLASAANAVYTLPPDKLAKAEHLYHARTLAHFGDTAWMILALWLLVRWGVGSRLRDWATRVSGGKWVQGFLVAPVWLLILSVLGLPVSAMMHRVYREYGISVEGWGMWLADFAKGTALTVVFGSLALAVLYALMQKSPRWWWVWFWLLAIPVEVAAVWAVPVFIDPMFNHFSRLDKADPALVRELERVAGRGGLKIPPSRMFVMDASQRYTAPNAYVTGFGGSKRIVVWDTTIEHVPQDEILAVYGHEQGHYVLEHIQKGIAFSAALMLLGLWIMYWLMEWLVRRYDARWGISSVDDWASLGLLLLVVTVLGFLGEPVGNAFSREIEHQADVYGQEVIQGLVPDAQGATVRSFQRLGEMWLDVPHPNPFVVFWTYSHPPTAEREAFAAGYDPWAKGEKPRYVGK